MGKLIAGIFVFAAILFAEEAPNPGEVSFENIIYGGSGCPQGSVGQILSPDAKAFTLLFDKYAVEGIADKNRPVRKNCLVNVRLKVPQGWSFGILGVDYRGFANLESGAIATQTTRAVIRGTHDRQVGRMTLQGPLAQDYLNRTTASLDNEGFTTCEGKSRNIAITSQIEVSGKGLMTVDSLDGELRNLFYLKWKKCAPSCKGFTTSGGNCFYAASRNGESCNQACATRGGASPAPLSDSECKSAVNTLLPLQSAITRGKFSQAAGSQLGCGISFNRDISIMNSPISIPGASDPRFLRVCACNGPT